MVGEGLSLFLFKFFWAALVDVEVTSVYGKHVYISSVCFIIYTVQLYISLIRVTVQSFVIYI